MKFKLNFLFLFLFLSLVAFVFEAAGGEIFFPASQVCTVHTNTFFSTNYVAPTNNGVTIRVTNVVWVAPAVNHTLQTFYTATGTNAVTDALDRSIDGVNWVNWFTNSATASFIFETNSTGTWLAFRRRTTLLTTNATLLTEHMGR